MMRCSGVCLTLNVLTTPETSAPHHDRPQRWPRPNQQTLPGTGAYLAGGLDHLHLAQWQLVNGASGVEIHVVNDERLAASRSLWASRADAANDANLVIAESDRALPALRPARTNVVVEDFGRLADIRLVGNVHEQAAGADPTVRKLQNAGRLARLCGAAQNSCRPGLHRPGSHDPANQPPMPSSSVSTDRASEGCSSSGIVTP